MSTISQTATFTELYDDLQNRVRTDTGITATENQAKRYINIALQDIHLGFDYRFPWAERNAILVTQPEYSTGTLSVNQGSTAITGSSTLWNTNNNFSVPNMRVGGKLQINGGSEVYEIESVTNDTGAVLTSVFTQANVSAGSYKYFEDEYALASDFLRPLDMMQFSSPLSIELVGRTEFRRRYIRNNITGKPFVATLIDRPPSGNTTPVRKVRLYKAPDIAYSIPYSYITSNLVVTSAGVAQAEFSGDTDEPIIPLRYRHALVLHALYNWYRDKRDDTRSQEVKAEYVDIMNRISSDTEIGLSRPILRARTAAYRRRATNPYSEGSSRFDLGGFDSGF